MRNVIGLIAAMCSRLFYRKQAELKSAPIGRVQNSIPGAVEFGGFATARISEGIFSAWPIAHARKRNQRGKAQKRIKGGCYRVGK